MSDPFTRSLSQIDGELRSIRTLDLDAGQQLSSIREQQARLRREIDVLIGHELFIEGNIEARKIKSDRLLDERLRSTASEQVSA